ncbi:MAG: 3-deoxy-7-phosphoheptulonate synthase [Anaerolineales bacterium]|nr:3-deoxy-7-phosphoheptulonate synthase [Anaerolineales bacterium]
MVVVMEPTAEAHEVTAVVAKIESLGYSVHLLTGEERTLVGLVGDGRPVDREQIEATAGVEKAVPILRPYKLASREMHPLDTQVALNGTAVGSKQIALIAGPCSVENRTQLLETAHAVREAGAAALRGGAFKPRTSPYSFQGLGEEGLELLAEAREQTGLPVVTEAMSPAQIPIVARYADVIQIGARNMQNFNLLRAAGKAGLPVLLKRGMMATIEEWLMAAEYLLSRDNSQVILCERGIRTFEKETRNTTDINAIPAVKALSHLPVILDPSHSTGQREYVAAVSRAGIAAGADGLMVEVHHRPDEALSDGAQSLLPDQFAELVEEVAQVAAAVGRGVPVHV